MREWIIQDLDFLVDDFTMDSAYDLLTAFTYKTGQCVYLLLPDYAARSFTGTVSRPTCSSSLTAGPIHGQENPF